MEWSDEGVILGTKPFGETGALAEIFTSQHGRAAALVHGGASKRFKPILQPGNSVSVTWKARTGEQLGFFAPLELSNAHAARILHDPLALAGLASAIALTRRATAERQAYPGLHEALCVLLEGLTQTEIWPAIYARYELGLLAEIGYGLDLSACAMTGAREGLAWVSPRTGRAATFEAGAPFADKLLRLAPFLTDPDAAIEPGDIADSLALTGHFLEARLFDPQGLGMPEARQRLIHALGHAGRL
jgi:DNA repair protein RecO (recombination protein O)